MGKGGRCGIGSGWAGIVTITTSTTSLLLNRYDDNVRFHGVVHFLSVGLLSCSCIFSVGGSGGSGLSFGLRVRCLDLLS